MQINSKMNYKKGRPAGPPFLYAVTFAYFAAANLAATMSQLMTLKNALM